MYSVPVEERRRGKTREKSRRSAEGKGGGRGRKEGRKKQGKKEGGRTHKPKRWSSTAYEGKEDERKGPRVSVKGEDQEGGRGRKATDLADLSLLSGLAEVFKEGLENELSAVCDNQTKKKIENRV